MIHFGGSGNSGTGENQWTIGLHSSKSFWALTYNSWSNCIIASDTNGRVGIGTTSPSYKLHVNGSIATGSADGAFIQIGGARIVWDNTNKALKVIQSDNSTAANFYATGAISALGQGVDGGGGGGQGDVTWALLASSSDTRQIALSHLTTALSGYATTSSLSNYLPLSGGTLSDAIIIHSTLYNNYNEGIRIQDAPNNWAGITFGATGSTGCAPAAGQVAWYVAKNNQGKFIITANGSATSDGLVLNKDGAMFWRDSEVYHAGNLPAYPTKSSWNYDDRYLRIDTDNTYGNTIDFTTTSYGIRCGGINGRFGSDSQLIHLYQRVNIGYPSGWGGQEAPTYGLSVYGGCLLATNTGLVGIATTSPETLLDVNGIQQIYQRGIDNTAFKNLLLLKAQNNTEPSGDSWADTYPTFGIGFRRYWSSGETPYGETTCAGIYATVSSSWRGGLVFRTKNNETQGGTHDVTALRLTPSGTAIFTSSVAATSFIGSLSGNAATATQLQTARTIWGQSFNGSANVSGSITGATNVEGSGYGRFGGASGIYIGATYAGGSSGYDCIERAGSGNTLYMHYYTSGSIIMCVGGGNVGIGTVSPSYKLHVNGTFKAESVAIENTNEIKSINTSLNLNHSVSSSIGLCNGGGDVIVLGNRLEVRKASEPNILFHSPNVAYGNIRIKSNNQFYFYIGDGNAQANAAEVNAGWFYSYGQVTALSDERDKNVVGNVGLSVEQIADAPAVRFLWKDGRADNSMQTGSIAQYWQKVLPEVIREKEDRLSLSYGVAGLVSAIVTARKVVDHEKIIQEHERKIAELQKENQRLKEMLNVA